MPAARSAASSSHPRTTAVPPGARAAAPTGGRATLPPSGRAGGRPGQRSGGAVVAPPAARSRPSVDEVRGRHRRPTRAVRVRRVVEAMTLVLAVGAAAAVVADQRGADVGAETLTAPGALPTPVPASAALTTPPPTVRAEPPVYQIAGPVPSAGRGAFGYDERTGPLLGKAGVLRRYRVAVEDGAQEDPAGFGAAVQAALAGPGSWVDSGRLRLQQVPGDAGHDFTVYLATARTAGRMCLAGGVDIRVGGRPYTSCRAPGKVIINLDRWRLSVPHFVAMKVPLSVYRLYVINHEVGHQLGNRHERCPGAGRPAPVMMQQTLFLDGCVANPWPYRDGRRYSGPPV